MEPQPARQIGLPCETDSHWAAIWKLVLRAEQLPAGERGAFLQSAETNPFIIRQAVAILEGSESLATAAASLPLAPEERFVPQTGMKIERYRVGTLLGSGGAGSVYSAFDEELNRPVAMKFVSSRRSGRSDAPALSLREARAASALDHPNIIMIHEVIETNETAAIVMELVKGVTLREAARTSPPLDQALRWSTQLGHALAVAHEVRRRVEAGAVAAQAQHRLVQRAARTFAVGAADRDHRAAELDAHAPEDRRHAVEAERDGLRMLALDELEPRGQCLQAMLSS